MTKKKISQQFHNVPWLRAQLASEPPAFNQQQKKAAVLIPIILHPHPTLLLTKRTEHLHDHPGQVSFPGGRVEENDSSIIATALRETYEEIGIKPESVRIVGYLPQAHQVINYNIIAVVGVIMPPLNLTLDSFEVASAFEVPLELILDRRNFASHELEHAGGKYFGYFFDYQGYNIWGATARMILSLSDVIALSDAEKISTPLP